MKFSASSLATAALLLAPVAAVHAADTPPLVAATRPEMKELLEKSKRSHPRLPLPPPSEADLADAKARGGHGPMSGIINNGRMRKLYLPREFLFAGFSREPDPAMTLKDPFKFMCFWIVSRANNCMYCQGHQEVKLSSAGVSEDTIAALDGDWSEFTEADRAAFAFTRKLTFEPNKLVDADLDRLRKFYTELQILEIITADAGFNAMNRWTGALAIPQEEHREYLTPTSANYQAVRSTVAPLLAETGAKQITCAKTAERGELESREVVSVALKSARDRTSRLPLASEEQTRALLPSDWSGAGPVPAWARLLANFPKAGKAWIAQTYHSQTKGRLNPRLKAEIAYVSARNDRAWYALGHAQQRLKDLGCSDAEIDALAQPGSSTPEPERLVLAFARKLTVDPALITDGDVENLRRQYSDFEVAEIVYQTTQGAFFNRLTEASGLPLEP